MPRTWKLISVSVVLSALSLCLLPTGPLQPRPALAGDCSTGNTGTLVITIIDLATDNELAEPGTQILIAPDPRDYVLDDLVTDTAIQDANNSRDRNSDPGVIQVEGACSTQGGEFYTATIFSLPSDLAECKIETGSDASQLAAGQTGQMTLEVDCTGVGPTPTATITGTAGPPATVLTNASPLTVSCDGTSVVNVQVRDAAGNPVKTGTAVTITTTLGSVSPSSGFVTGSNGSVYAFFTAPATSGGLATITAKAGSASGEAKVAINCGLPGATNTVAPPPTLITGGVIQPPNTGDAGLAGPSTGLSSLLLAGFVTASSFGAIGLMALRRRFPQ